MNETAYSAALHSAALYDENNHGRIRMRGASAADLLHRLSTNDMLKLKPGQGTRTVLTTPIGRIIDLLTIYQLEDSLIVITGQNQGGVVFGYLRKNIFFNDNVTLEPLGRSHAQFTLYGPQAGALVERLHGDALPDLPMHGTTTVTLAGSDVLVARSLPIGGAGLRLLVSVEMAEAVRTAILDAGAAVLDEATFDVLRVEQGYGAVGHELSQAYIPLETGLHDAISFTKGCYVGQEIIARMESRGRLAKTLRGLKLHEPGTENQGSLGDVIPDSRFSVLEQTKLDVDGKEAGDLTSVVVSPRFGVIGLAYVRTAHAEPGTRFGITGGVAVGESVELPFS